MACGRKIRRLKKAWNSFVVILGAVIVVVCLIAMLTATTKYGQGNL